MSKKWYPGHYLSLGTDKFVLPSKHVDLLKDDTFRGVFLYLTWSRVEPDNGRWDWSQVDALLDQIPAGKKLAVSLAWQSWPGGPDVPVPADMVGNPVYDGGYRIRTERGPRPFATIHMPKTCDRYLRMARQFARQYDTDERLAFVTSAEIPYPPSLRVGQYDEATARGVMARIARTLPVTFVNTPAGMLGAWWPHGGGKVAASECAHASFQAGGGWGFPDLSVNETEDLLSDVVEHGKTKPIWMGMEWDDYLPERTGQRFPADQLAKAARCHANFIWWLPVNRKPDGGHDFMAETLPALRLDHYLGIDRTVPA